MKLKFLTDAHDPRIPGYERYITSLAPSYESFEARKERHDKWIRQYFIGESQGGHATTLVGVYSFGIAGAKPDRIVNYDGWLIRWNSATELWTAYNAPLDIKLTFDENTCSDCKGSGEYQGYLTIEECHRCKGKGTTYPLAC